MATFKCIWCGNHTNKPVRESFFSTKSFCGKKCLTEYQKQKGEANYSKAETKVFKAQQEILELEQQKIRNEQDKKDNQELAIKTFKIYTAFKPYLKFIIPLYIIAFLITFFSVDEDARILPSIFFGFPILFAIYLIINYISNKPE